MRHLLALLLLSIATGLHAQDTTDYVTKKPPAKERVPFKDRIWFGGGIGLNFGSVTAIQLDPLVGYYLDHDRKLSTGLGLSYWYYRDNRFSPAIEQNAYGYRVFTRYRVIEQAYLHAEFLHLNAERFFTRENAIERIWVPHLLLGAGYVQPLGSGSSIYFQILFEVLQDPNSVYLNQGPIISAGVGIGF